MGDGVSNLFAKHRRPLILANQQLAKFLRMQAVAQGISQNSERIWGKGTDFVNTDARCRISLRDGITYRLHST